MELRVDYIRNSDGWGSTMLLMGKLTVSMAIFNSCNGYVSNHNHNVFFNVILLGLQFLACCIYSYSGYNSSWAPSSEYLRCSVQTSLVRQVPFILSSNISSKMIVHPFGCLSRLSCQQNMVKSLKVNEHHHICSFDFKHIVRMTTNYLSDGKDWQNWVKLGEWSFIVDHPTQ